MPNLMYLPYIYRSDIIPLNLTERGGGEGGGGGGGGGGKFAKYSTSK